MDRRTFLTLGVGAVGGLSFRLFPLPSAVGEGGNSSDQPFRISLAEWSLNKTIRAGKMTNLDFPRVAKREFDIDCIEFVDQFFSDKAKDKKYLSELKTRAGDEGVSMGLIMIDTNGPLATKDPAVRRGAVERTYPWIDAAKFLGCHTVRVNAWGDGSADELRKGIVESCILLADYAAQRGLNVVIENHGGSSSDPEWLVSVMKGVNKPNFGTLPDFGNFPSEVNRYDAVEMFMPYAKAVSAKSGSFSPDGLAKETDFFRMMRIVRDAGYTGHVGVESGASSQEGEADAIRMTRDLLKRIREEQVRCKPIFNRRNLAGWMPVNGGEWRVEKGALLGGNGQGWSPDPEKAGSWLRTRKQYGDFRLELQYSINTNGGSGVFFRSAAAKNPAVTGYELQIVDAAGQQPSPDGPSSIPGVAAPAKNLVRPAGSWNTVTIIARGAKIIVEINGEKVIDAENSRSLRGYIGLQNQDERSVVRFRNIRLEELSG